MTTLSRRQMLQRTAAAAALATPFARALATPAPNPTAAALWDRCELTFPGPSSGNPFVDVQLSATFQHASDTIKVAGFYDGNGLYRIRFMPTKQGSWTYTTQSNRPELTGKSGTINVTAPTSRGPVHVFDKYRFSYADGSPYRELGTTCYAWTSQPAALEEQTLATLRTAPFNKMRMCVFPKWYTYNRAEPPLYAFVGTAPTQWDFTRFNPAFFQHLEGRIAQLAALNIQADLILFHPYDEGHWGFDQMSAANDERYLRYVIARLGAYSNVWWSLANEWDIFKTKSEADFERIGQIIAEADPYHHLTSIHQQKKMFDHTRPWITHVSVQDDNPDNSAKFIRQYNKPVIFDECRYEGDIPQGWGDITAERLVANFWKTLVSGTFCGHGETYLNAREELWWSKGGVLTGRAPAMLAFYKSIVEAAPPESTVLAARNTWGVEFLYYLTYLWDRQHATQSYQLPVDARFRADIIDTQALTITTVPGTFSGKADIPLPIKPWLAIRLQRL